MIALLLYSTHIHPYWMTTTTLSTHIGYMAGGGEMLARWRLETPCKAPSPRTGISLGPPRRILRRLERMYQVVRRGKRVHARVSDSLVQSDFENTSTLFTRGARVVVVATSHSDSICIEILTRSGPSKAEFSPSASVFLFRFSGVWGGKAGRNENVMSGRRGLADNFHDHDVHLC